jgi:hypothetical protein
MLLNTVGLNDLGVVVSKPIKNLKVNNPKNI